MKENNEMLNSQNQSPQKILNLQLEGNKLQHSSLASRSMSMKNNHIIDQSSFLTNSFKAGMSYNKLAK